ncbi:hypothetical protein RvY_00542 [Ramazzottius varieornatus]|uniref:Uncharacterized protein n=1 Tax=Ramazzottius varieornatus TaxID=947166 RepID=A0A1D1UKE4_RAMVA|nr:hypothetical protein RvY_00542 [Ramazzottius varieornatus]
MPLVDPRTHHKLAKRHLTSSKSSASLPENDSLKRATNHPKLRAVDCSFQIKYEFRMTEIEREEAELNKQTLFISTCNYPSYPVFQEVEMKQSPTELIDPSLTLPASDERTASRNNFHLSRSLKRP